MVIEPATSSCQLAVSNGQMSEIDVMLSQSCQPNPAKDGTLDTTRLRLPETNNGNNNNNHHHHHHNHNHDNDDNDDNDDNEDNEDNDDNDNDNNNKMGKYIGSSP